LFGEWRYLATPITRRDAAGGGRVGVFGTIRDEDIPTFDASSHPSVGFTALQRGGER
jgi:hypothetical protein